MTDKITARINDQGLGNFEQYAPAYVANWNALAVRSNRLAEANAAAKALIAGKAMYEQCSAACGGIPWWFFGICLYRENEDDFLHQRFESYLGNGQPLDRRTTLVPAGRGPFKTFVAGAVDAMRLQGYIGATDWGVARTCYRIEGENGFGYHLHGVNSPYLYGGTTLYGPPQAKGGKYTGDDQYNPNVVDTQLGTLAILKCAMALDPTIEFASANVQEAPKMNRLTAKLMSLTPGAITMIVINCVVAVMGVLQGVDWVHIIGSQDAGIVVAIITGINAVAHYLVAPTPVVASARSSRRRLR